MFKKNKKKNKVKTIFFVVFSLVGLLFLLSLVYLWKFNFIIANSQISQGFYRSSDFPKYIKTDPFITKVVWPQDEIDSPIINNFDPRLGEKTAKIKIFYFTDFECDFCRSQEETLLRLAEEFKDNIFLMRKDYPLTDVESFSWRAAVAGRCAAEQGKFWEYNFALQKEIDGHQDKNYFSGEQGKLIDDDFFIDLAEQIGVRTNIFSGCLEDSEISNMVRDNIIEAQILNIKGIPFIYINDKEVMGDITYEELKNMIVRELEKE